MTPKKKPPTVDEMIEYAETVRDAASATRANHRRRTSVGSHQRETDIGQALHKLKRAMAPIRSFLARAPYGPQSHTLNEQCDRLRAISQELQEERRKLWKMQRKNVKRRRTAERKKRSGQPKPPEPDKRDETLKRLAAALSNPDSQDTL